MHASADDVDGFAVDVGAKLGTVDPIKGAAAHLIVDEGLEVGGVGQQVDADLAGVFEVGGSGSHSLSRDCAARGLLSLDELDMEDDLLRSFRGLGQGGYG